MSHALSVGYRHLDCALIYMNENEVGQGIKDSGVPRSDIFITSKLWNTHHPDVASGLEQTLKALGTDYLDLYVSAMRLAFVCFHRSCRDQLIHWPVRLVPVSVRHDQKAVLPNADRSRIHRTKAMRSFPSIQTGPASSTETGTSARLGGRWKMSTAQAR